MAKIGHQNGDMSAGGILPCALYLLLGLVLAGIFCWRVATTDPSWKAKPVAAVAAPQPAKSVPVEKAEPMKETVVELPARPAPPKPEVQKPARKIPTHAQVSEYFAAKLGEQIPLLRDGGTRSALLTAFDDDAFVVRVGQTELAPIPRASLSPDQLALWNQ